MKASDELLKMMAETGARLGSVALTGEGKTKPSIALIAVVGEEEVEEVLSAVKAIEAKWVSE